MRTILHRNNNDENVLTTVAAGYDIDKVKDALKGVIIDLDSIDQDYLGAYDIVDNNISIDIEKAKKIKVDLIREQRDQVFITFDKTYDIALRDEIDMTELKQQRQRLKDAPQTAAYLLTSHTILEQINSLTLQDLL